MQKPYAFKLMDLLAQALCVLLPAISVFTSTSTFESNHFRRFVFCNLVLGVCQVISAVLNRMLLGVEFKHKYRYLFTYLITAFVLVSLVAIGIVIANPNDNSNNGLLITWLAGGSAALELWYLWITIDELRQMKQ